MTDAFTLGHYLYNARNLRKTAAETPQERQARIDRGFDRELQISEWENRNGMPEGVYRNAVSDNMTARNNGQDRSHHTNIKSNKEGGLPVYRKQAPLGPMRESLNALSGAFGYDNGSRVIGDPNNPRFMPPEDKRFLRQIRNPANTTLDFLTNPLFTAPAMAAGMIDTGSAEGNAAVGGLGLAGGWAASRYAPGLVSKMMGSTGTKIAQSMPWKVVSTGGKWIGRGAGAVEGAIANLDELTKPQSQVNAEMENEGEYIRRSALGNSPAARRARRWTNFMHAVPIGVDVAADTAAAVTRSTTPLMFSNGQLVKAYRGFKDSINNKTGSPLEAAAMTGFLHDLSVDETWGGGKVGGEGRDALLYQKAISHPTDMNRLAAWNKMMQDKGYTPQQIRQQREAINRRYPNYFAANMSDADRNRTDVETFAKARSDYMQQLLRTGR